MALTALFDASFDRFNASIKNAAVHLQTFDRAVSTSSRDLKRDMESLSGQKAAAEVTRLAEAVKRLGGEGGTAAGVLKLTQAEVQRLSGVVGEAVTKFKALGEQVPPHIQKLQQELRAAEQSARTFADRVGEIGTKMQTLGGKMQSAGTTLSAAVTLPLVGLGTAAIKAGTQFEGSMNKIQGVLSPTVGEMEAVRAKAIEMGAATAFSATDAANAMLEMGKAGFSVAESLGSVDEVLDLAAASGLEMGAAAEMAARTMKSFGLETKDLAHINDVLAKAVNISTLEITDLQTAFNYVGPIAQGFGVSIETATAALATMRDAGIAAETSGRALREGLERLANPVKAVHEVIGKLGLNIKDVNPELHSLGEIVGTLKDRGLTAAQALKLFGSAAGSGMFALIKQGQPALENLTKQLVESENAAKNMGKALMEGLPGALERLKGSVETALISISKAMEPALLPILSKLEGLANVVTMQVVPAFQALPPYMQTATLTVLAMTAAIGPALLALGSFVKLFGLAATGLVPVIAGLTTLANTTPILTARIWLLDTAQKAAAASASLMAGAFGLVLAGGAVIAGITAMGAAIWEVVKAVQGHQAAIEKGKGLEFLSARDEDNFVRRWLGMSTAAKKGAQEINDASADAMTGIQRFQSLLSQLGGEDAAKDLKQLHDAFYELNNRGQMSADVMKNIGLKAKELQAAGATLSPELRAIVGWLDSLEKVTKRTAVSTGEATGKVNEFRKVQDALFSRDDIAKALDYAKQLGQIGNVSLLTKDKKVELKKAVEAALEAYKALGKEAPAHLLAIVAATTPLLESTKQLATNFVALKVPVTDAGIALQNMAAGLEANGNLMSRTIPEATEHAREAEKAFREWATANGVLIPTIANVNSGIGETATATKHGKDRIGELSQALTQLAQVSGGTFGDMVKQIATLVVALDAGTKSGDAMLAGWKQWRAGGKNASDGLASLGVGALGAASALGQATEHGNTLQRTLSGVSTGAAIGTAIMPGLGTAVGAVAGAVVGLVRGWIAHRKAVKEAREDIEKFQTALHGMLSGSQLQEAGNRRWAATVISVRDAFLKVGRSAADAEAIVKQLWDTKHPEAAKAAMLEIAAVMDQLKEEQDGLNAAIERYGFTIEELGPTMQKQKLTEMAQQLIQDFHLLTQSGIDVGLVTGKMSDEINEYLRLALKTSHEVPASMKPMLQSMVEMGLLTDADGNKLTDLTKIPFAETMTQGFNRIVTALEKVALAITGTLSGAADDTREFVDRVNDSLYRIPRHIEIDVEGRYNAPNIPTGGGGEGFASGTMGRMGKWFQQFGSGTPTILHGEEAVVRKDQATEFAMSVLRELFGRNVGFAGGTLGGGDAAALLASIESVNQQRNALLGRPLSADEGQRADALDRQWDALKKQLAIVEQMARVDTERARLLGRQLMPQEQALANSLDVQWDTLKKQLAVVEQMNRVDTERTQLLGRQLTQQEQALANSLDVKWDSLKKVQAQLLISEQMARIDAVRATLLGRQLTQQEQALANKLDYQWDSLKKAREAGEGLLDLLVTQQLTIANSMTSLSGVLKQMTFDPGQTVSTTRTITLQAAVDQINQLFQRYGFSNATQQQLNQLAGAFGWTGSQTVNAELVTKFLAGLERIYVMGGSSAGQNVPNYPGYASGTMGRHGSLFHDFAPRGELVTAHGEEAIIPKAQWPGIAASLGQSSGPVNVYVAVDPKTGGVRVLSDYERRQVQTWINTGELTVPQRMVTGR